MALATIRRGTPATNRGQTARAAGPSVFERELRELERQGLARLEGGTVAVTAAGIAFLQRRFPRDGRR